ncbi:hypothetical protein WJX82_006239 [Trebouxia sp. C0006]
MLMLPRLQSSAKDSEEAQAVVEVHAIDNDTNVLMGPQGTSALWPPAAWVTCTMVHALVKAADNVVSPAPP